LSELRGGSTDTPTARFRVFALVTSCTPDFDLNPSERLTRHTYLVGRFQQADGQRIFVALARGADGEFE
jgi:hypothetical protein